TLYDAITKWWKKRDAVQVEKDWIVPTPRVMPGLAAAVEALTSPGDKILVQPPVYNHCFVTVNQSHCELVANNLLYENGDYQIDFDDLENKAADPAVRSEEHTSELQSRENLVCRLLLEKKQIN